MSLSSNTACCFFCGRDLSIAASVNLVAEGPCCSICLARISSAHQQGTELGLGKRCPLCHGSGEAPGYHDVDEFYADDPPTS